MKHWFRALQGPGRRFVLREPIEVAVSPIPGGGFLCMYGFDCDGCAGSICTATETDDEAAVVAAVGRELSDLWEELVEADEAGLDADDLCERQHLLDLVQEAKT